MRLCDVLRSIPSNVLHNSLVTIMDSTQVPLVDKDPPSMPDSPTASTDSGLLVNMTDSQFDTHVDRVPKAENTPEHVEALPTTVEAPALGPGNPENAAEPDLEDLGWSEDPKIPVPVLHGMRNEELWMLVRRFNKSIYYVRSVPPPPGKLDLSISPEEEFFPDKLRSTIERLYMTVIIGTMATVKHIARIRSWNERERTAWFCAVYFVAWASNFLMPVCFATLIALILHPPTRRKLFPPAPLALISTKGGNEQTPQAGYLGSKDSLTGAAEAYKGQAVEQEASNFVTGFASIAVGSATGQGAPSASASVASDEIDSADENATVSVDAEVGSSLPDPTSIVGGAANAQSTAFGESAKHDKTKKHVENAMWESAGPIMHGIAMIADIWERFANGLSPIPPFAQNTARLRFAAVVFPVLLLSLFLNEAIVYKSMTFAFGFGMFGQPIFDKLAQARVREWLDRHYPTWRDFLDINNTLLYGVPSNAQLTITLLRVGEASKRPLPPPPAPGLIQPPDTPTLEEPTAADDEEVVHEESALSTQSKKKSSKLVGMIKGTTKAGVASLLGADRIKATVGSEPAKSRLGVVNKKKYRPSDGPTMFKARHHGKKGTAVIGTTATPPCISFVQNMDTPLKAEKPIWTIAVDEIAEMRKIGGLGWKGKLVVGWAMGSEVTDGIEITDKQGRTERLTAMPRRDEVFNRLISLSKNQHWESW